MKSSRFISTLQIENFCDRLSDLNPEDLGLENYQASYLANLLTHKKYFISIYATVLNELLTYSPKEKEHIFLVDYGAGNGLLGLFAKYCGFGKVVQVDTSSACCFSQRILSERLGLPVDENIHGDYQSLNKLSVNPPDALVATDVIEHIYDLDDFFASLQKINGELVVIFTTASNDRNWWKKRKLMKVQKKDEWEGDDFCEPFRMIRSKIIKDEIPQITHSELNLLIDHTRGLRKVDIESACRMYKENGIVPPLLLHPTNTCDPISGSWTERFLSFDEYRLLFNKYGFSLTIKSGFYNGFRKGIKGKVAGILNALIHRMKTKGSVLSPFIILIGR
ncbi:MAG: hypothetical protein H3C48_11855 [Chitinophagaceae bacterium]|nr:hypothetical protein [Chitinophagaceae bacterium]